MDKTKQLGEEKISKLLLSYSLPAIAGSIISSLYNVIDRIFIGNGGEGAGTLGIAGISIGLPIMLIFVAASVFIGMGAMALVSIRLGEGKNKEAEKIIGNSLLLLIAFPAVMIIPGEIFLNRLLVAFGASSEVLPYARDYMIFILIGSLFQLVAMGMNSYMRAEGKPKKAMATFAIGAATNSILAPLFIYVFKWGMTGAGLATCLAQVVTCVWVMTHFLSGKSMFKISFETMKPDLKIIKNMMKIGIAPSTLMLANSFLGVFMNHSLAKYGGDLAVSAMGTVTSLSNFLIMPVMGINMGSQPIIGYNFGARKYDRVKQALKAALISGVAIATVGFILTRLIPSQMISIFNGSDKELIAFGSKTITIFLLLQPLAALQMVGAYYFQAVNKPALSILLSLSRQIIIMIPALIILPKFWGIEGVLASGPVADFLAAIITAACLAWEVRTLNKNQASVALEAKSLTQSS